MKQIEQKSISANNAHFWDELCGSQLAKTLGISDSSAESLERFDNWYFNYYPYLQEHIPFREMHSKDVLEIGLGYGSVSQRLAACGANYTGLDIASGPVNMINHRLRIHHLPGKAVQGSILAPAFPPNSFDFIVAIGCLHHTGDMAAAIARCYNLLRPSGVLVIMVYYAYSYRRFLAAANSTLRYLGRELCGYRGCVGPSTRQQRAAYDSNSNGEEAPHTDWISIRSLRHFCNNFSHFSASLENIDQEGPFASKPRSELLQTFWSTYLGLDIYAQAVK